MNVFELKKRVGVLINEYPALILDSVMDNSNMVSDLNVKQLEQGKTNEGKSITPKYQSKIYENYKKAIGAKPPKGTPDLKVEGDFHHGIYTEKKGKEYVYTYSTDKKADKLNSKYPHIFGLNKQSMIIIKPFNVESSLIRVRKILFH